MGGAENLRLVRSPRSACKSDVKPLQRDHESACGSAPEARAGEGWEVGEGRSHVLHAHPGPSA